MSRLSDIEFAMEQFATNADFVRLYHKYNRELLLQHFLLIAAAGDEVWRLNQDKKMTMQEQRDMMLMKYIDWLAKMHVEFPDVTRPPDVTENWWKLMLLAYERRPISGKSLWRKFKEDTRNPILSSFNCHWVEPCDGESLEDRFVAVRRGVWKDLGHRDEDFIAEGSWLPKQWYAWRYCCYPGKNMRAFDGRLSSANPTNPCHSLANNMETYRSSLNLSNKHVPMKHAPIYTNENTGAVNGGGGGGHFNWQAMPFNIPTPHSSSHHIHPPPSQHNQQHLHPPPQHAPPAPASSGLGSHDIGAQSVLQQFAQAAIASLSGTPNGAFSLFQGMNGPSINNGFNFASNSFDSCHAPDSYCPPHSIALLGNGLGISHSRSRDSSIDDDSVASVYLAEVQQYIAQLLRLEKAAALAELFGEPEKAIGFKRKLYEHVQSEPPKCPPFLSQHMG